MNTRFQTLSRREFLRSSATITATLAIAPRWAHARPPQLAADRFFAWEEAATGVWVATSPAGGPMLGANSTLLLGESAAALIDCKYPSVGAALRREAASFGKPLTHVVNTHHHADHTGGNLAFTADLPVFAHAAAAPRVQAQLKRYQDGLPGDASRIAKMPGDAARAVAAEAHDLAARAADLKAEEFTPTRAIDLAADLDLAGVRTRPIHPGPAHTDNDVALFLPAANALVCGDLLFNALHPVLDRSAGGTSRGWIAAIAALESLCDDQTVVIPGHGALGHKAALRAQADYFGSIRALMAQAVKDGQTRDAALKTSVPDAYKDYGFPQRFPLILGALYDEASEEAATTPPRPSSR